LDERSYLVDAVVRRAVDLEHVDRRARENLLAGGALVARLGAFAIRAVERASEQPRNGGLADAADAGEEEGVGHAVTLDRVRKRVGDVPLADDAVEGERPPAAGYDFIGHVESRVCDAARGSARYTRPAARAATKADYHRRMLAAR